MRRSTLILVITGIILVLLVPILITAFPALWELIGITVLPTGVYELATLVLGIVSVYLAWKEYANSRTISQARDFIAIHDKVRAYASREQVTARLAEIVDRAQKGDVVFGHCRICTGYPLPFFSAIPRAGERGVKFQFVVSDRPETREFLDYLQGLSSYMEAKIAREPIYASVFGIRGKEILFCHHMLDRSFGIHFNDAVTTTYLQAAFDPIWNRSEAIGMRATTK